MKLGLFGKGKLGSAIARAAGDQIVWQVAREEPPEDDIDCAIEASLGAGVERHLTWAIATETPLVIASSGFELGGIVERVRDRTAVLLAPNLSVAVAFFTELTAVLARFASLDPQRDPYLVEQHHARKLDAPGGTARMLAHTILANCPRKTSFTAPHAQNALRPDELNVSAIRAGYTASSHTVGVDAPGEVIEITHRARDYSPYGEGALLAARWLAGRRGVFDMSDVTRDLFAPLFAERHREVEP